MKSVRPFLPMAMVLVSTLVLGACSETTLDKAAEVSPSTDAHGMVLYKGYLALAQAEHDEEDDEDRDYFADRAIRAAMNEKFEPQNITARDLPVDHLNEMAAARRELVFALYQGAETSVPEHAGEAQVAFDCWIQEQEEDLQPDDIGDCKARFDAAMAEIQANFSPEPDKRLHTYRHTIDVFFNLDSADLTTDSVERVAAMAGLLEAYEKPVLTVVGNADQSGADDYNVELSQKRADAVVAELAKHGVVPDAVVARGDQAPEIDVGRAPEMLNRRVMMIVREAEAT